MKFGDDGGLVQLARTAVALARAGRIDEAVAALDALIGAARNERTGLLVYARRDEHRKAARESMAELRRRRVESGLCRDCGARLPDDEVGRFIRCGGCRDILAGQVQKSRNRGAGE